MIEALGIFIKVCRVEFFFYFIKWLKERNSCTFTFFSVRILDILSSKLVTSSFFFFACLKAKSASKLLSSFSWKKKKILNIRVSLNIKKVKPPSCCRTGWLTSSVNYNFADLIKFGNIFLHLIIVKQLKGKI